MGLQEILAKSLADRFPDFMPWLTLFIVVLLLVAAPIAFFVILKNKFNKGRWVFERKAIPGERDHLYMLDTMTGHLYWVDGKAHYQRVHHRDWKEDRAQEATEK